MYRQPRTIKQLNERLKPAYAEVFPYGKHKNELVAEVVKTDPNYIVWWNDTIEAFPLDPKIVQKGVENYRELPKSGHWKGSIGHWDHWGDGCDEDWESMDDYPESVLGDPWDPRSPF